MRLMIFIYIITLPIMAFSQARRGQSLIQKQKLNEAYTLLNKAIAKDSLASAEKYVLSGLFFNLDFERNDLDSAYYFILAAISALEMTPEKLYRSLESRGFNLEVYNELKGEIEKTGFQRAVTSGKEQDFIDFLDEFNTSTYIDSAIMLRNSLAFEYASNSNTYRAYKHFFETYPEASEVPEARKRYEKLLYNAKTADGKLESYKNFLHEYPDTWYRDEAEQIIYNIITGKFTVEAFDHFLDLYPDSHLSEEAILSKYSLLPSDQRAEYLETSNLASIKKDSILTLLPKLNQLIIPVIHDHRYQVITANADILVENMTNISEADKCQMINTGLVLELKEGAGVIRDLNDSVLTEGSFTSFEDFGNGIIKLSDHESQYIMHHGGFRSNPHKFKKVMATGRFIAYKDKKWGLESITGISLLAPKYDTIYAFHNFLVINYRNDWALQPMEYFYPMLDGDQINLEFDYEQIIIENDSFLILMKGEESALMNKDGKFIVPLAIQGIELVEGGYFIDRTDSILDSRVSKNWYYNISKNKNWTVADKGQYTDIFYKGKPLFVVDDAELLGNTALKIIRNDSTYCYFSDSTKLFLGSDDYITPIRKMGENSSERHFIFTLGEKQKVYSNKAQHVNVGKFDRLFDLGEEYMLRRIKGSSDLLTDAGRIALKGIDAATSLGYGYVSYLKEGKFGLYNQSDTTMIKPKYDRPLTFYNKNSFIATKDNKYGLINRKDSVLVPLIYNEIVYLSDSIVVLNNKFRWLFWDLIQAKVLLDNVSDYWQEKTSIGPVYKIFKGIGYGLWAPASGVLLNPTFGDIDIVSEGEETLFVAEKWVEEADIVVMLYYDQTGSLLMKEILSTSEYEDLSCKEGQD